MKHGNKNITGIILAGGQSSRMGAVKGLIMVNGHPLIYYPVELLKKTCKEVIISTNLDVFDFLGLKTVQDIYPDKGPMSGILSCLMQSTTELNFVLSCDMPFVTSQILAQLLIVKGDSDICVPWYEGDHFEPLCGIYSRKIIPKMDSFLRNDNTKLPEFFQQVSFMPWPVKQSHPPLAENVFFNINTVEDVDLANRLFKQEKSRSA